MYRHRNDDEVFDSKRYVADVLRWLQSQHVSRRALARMANVDLSSLLYSLRGDYPMTISMAWRLAEPCALDVDDYRIDPITNKEPQPND